MSLSIVLPVGCGQVDVDGADGGSGAADDGGGIEEVTLSQANSSAVTGWVTCGNEAMHTSESSFYRAFALGDFDIVGSFHIRRVTFGVYRAIAGGGVGSQPAELKIHKYSGPVGGDALDPSMLTMVSSTAFPIPDVTEPRTIDVRLVADIDGSTSFVVELFVPNGQDEMNLFQAGVNTQGERAPAYFLAPTCLVSEPTSFNLVGFPSPDYVLVLSVTGDGRRSAAELGAR